MTDTYIVPKWCFSIAVLLLSILILSIKKLCKRSIHLNISLCAYIIIITCLLQSIYGIIQWFQGFQISGSNRSIGSFDNPAGFASCLSVSLPFLLLCLKPAKRLFQKILICTLALVLTSAVIISGSRTGMISIIAIIALGIFQYIPLKTAKKATLLICVFSLFLSGSYFLKKDSADGRLLIWKCSWEMVKDAPLFGHGWGGFRANYMDYQANYFKEQPDEDKYEMLADNVSSPFNECLTIIISLGIIGLLGIVILVLFLFKYYDRDHNEDKRYALLSLVAIGVFSMFSYPFTYPFTWFMLLFNLYALLKGFICKWTNLRIVVYSLNLALMVFSLAGLYKLSQRIKGEYEWKKLTRERVTDKVLDDYQKLMHPLGEDPYFLYNYAVTLLEAGRLDESLNVALKCRFYWADYDLNLLLGDICKEMKKWDLAESYYESASYMCPCRFIPLYQLFDLYRNSGRKDKAESVAERIISKPVKIQTGTVWMIKRRINEYMESNK